MSNIIHVDFKARTTVRTFSADVYSFDIKKYQFQAEASSITEAYDAFVAESALYGVKVIQCMAIYFGLAEERCTHQLPAKVWQQDDQTTGVLVEY